MVGYQHVSGRIDKVFFATNEQDATVTKVSEAVSQADYSACQHAAMLAMMVVASGRVKQVAGGIGQHFQLTGTACLSFLC